MFVSTLLLLSLPVSETPVKHWAFEPRRVVAPPSLTDTWIRTPLDAFVLAKLREKGLQPAAAADRGTLIRRVTFDLTGLPPTPEEVKAFLEDQKADAYERLVDRLLASPRYGERWGRHWLDVVRFSESEGFEYDRLRPGAWRFRDYVIKAFNDDKPLDRFILEQVAGDELDANDHTNLIAAGFHRLGPVRRNAGNKELAMSRNEVLTEMTDAIGTAFLGLTVGCARCHDHRFDPISLKDYYQLQAFAAATQEHDLVLASAEEQAAWHAATEKAKAEIQVVQKKLPPPSQKPDPALVRQIDDMKRSLPAPLPTISTVKNKLAERTVIHVLRRGDPERRGAVVGPRVLEVAAIKDWPELPADCEQPRLRLARWLAEPDHPLTARVWVNRVWQYHFGKGLVATANDFGTNGATPSHPELLDYLANEFIRLGQRTKPLHRLIVLSSVYRQAATANDIGLTKKLDPDNRLLSHFPRRRLSAEEIRDAMLFVAGTLNERLGGPSVMLPADDDLVDQLYDPSQWKVTADTNEHRRRSVYMVAKRNLQLPFFQVFDQPTSQTSCAQREASTHALQALELLNGTISNRLAETLAQRLERECGSDQAKRVERAFWLIAGRAPTDNERRVSERFLERRSIREFALAMFNVNAFLYVE